MISKEILHEREREKLYTCGRVATSKHTCNWNVIEKGQYRQLFVCFILGYSCFTMLCQFLLHGNVNQICVCVCVYTYISTIIQIFFPFTSPRALSRVPFVIQEFLISYLLYTQQSIYVNPNLPVRPTPVFPLVPKSWFSIDFLFSIYFILYYLNLIHNIHPRDPPQGIH